MAMNAVKLAKYSLITATLLFLIYMYLSWLALGTAFIPTVLGNAHYVLSEGVGTSMYPTIHNGDYLIIQIDINTSKLKVGDIIAYIPPINHRELIGHRIIKVLKNGFIVKGDHNPVPDPWIVKRNEVVGKVVWIIDNPLYKRIAATWYGWYNG